MITAYTPGGHGLVGTPVSENESVPADAVWIDLFSPGPGEEDAVQTQLGFRLPSPEDMREIELSSRLYQSAGARYMTITVLLRADTENPESAPVTFILAGHRLVTLRYVDPSPFRAYIAEVARSGAVPTTGEAVLGGLLDAIIDRLADILEMVQNENDRLSLAIFKRNDRRDDMAFTDILRQIGLAQGLTARAYESLVSIERLLTFISRNEENTANAVNHLFSTVARDVAPLSENARFLANNINFLMNATLGMINIQQTGIIKIFSVAAVIFLPPTLIASIYGMNFALMPELDWPWGYPFAGILMLFSALLPLWYFKRRGWL